MINVRSFKNDRGEIQNDLLPDLTPLIDVMFMLIIFLILTMNVAHKKIDVQLPSDKENLLSTTKNEKIIDLVIFNNKDQWSLDGKKFNSYNQLKIALTKLKNKQKNIQKLNIISDKSVEVEKLVNLLIFLESNNIESSNIIVE